MGKESHQLDNENREKEEEKLLELFREYAKFYEMPPNIEVHDITEQILNSSFVKDSQKQLIKTYNRKICVFIYPSDGLKIKGLISFVPDPENHPLLVLLRGGTGFFSILNPGSDLMCPKQYTVISTMYRGGISEGVDEYGGDDVNDVKNLISFLPKLENKLGLNFQNKAAFLVGCSRGGMQMFLTLARFPELQDRFSKVVSLSGLLDMRHTISTRSDLEEMFIKDFELKKSINEEAWISKRDPLLTVSQLNRKLPILIIQGNEDNRVELQEGYNMVNKLQSAGNDVTYWEIEGGKHCLKDMDDRVKLILNWLEE